MTNLLNIGRAGLASKNRPHFRAGGLYPSDTLISSCWQLRPQNRRRASPGLRPSQNAQT